MSKDEPETIANLRSVARHLPIRREDAARLGFDRQEDRLQRAALGDEHAGRMLARLAERSVWQQRAKIDHPKPCPPHESEDAVVGVTHHHPEVAPAPIRRDPPSRVDPAVQIAPESREIDYMPCYGDEIFVFATCGLEGSEPLISGILDAFPTRGSTAEMSDAPS